MLWSQFMQIIKLCRICEHYIVYIRVDIATGMPQKLLNQKKNSK